MEDSGLVAAAGEGSPPSDRGHSAGPGVRPVGGQAGWRDGRGEGHGLGETEDGVVAIGRLGVVVGVLDDLGHLNLVEGVVADDVFTQEDSDFVSRRSGSAVSGREHVGGGDKGASTEWGLAPLAPH